MPAKAGIQYTPISPIITTALEHWIPDSLASLGFGNDEKGTLGERVGTRRYAPLCPPYSSTVAVTGTWSEGCCQPRVCLLMRMSQTRSPNCGATQM